MEQELQKLNADQHMTVQTQRIADCRGLGKEVKYQCQEKGIRRIGIPICREEC